MLFLALVFAVLALARLARILDTDLGGNSVGAEFLLFVVNTRQVGRGRELARKSLTVHPQIHSFPHGKKGGVLYSRTHSK